MQIWIVNRQSQRWFDWIINFRQGESNISSHLCLKTKLIFLRIYPLRSKQHFLSIRCRNGRQRGSGSKVNGYLYQRTSVAGRWERTLPGRDDPGRRVLLNLKAWQYPTLWFERCWPLILVRPCERWGPSAQQLRLLRLVLSHYSLFIHTRGIPVSFHRPGVDESTPALLSTPTLGRLSFILPATLDLPCPR